MLDHEQVLEFIDEPSPFDTLQTWEGYLAEVARSPESPLKLQLIRTARVMIDRKARLRRLSIVDRESGGTAKA